MPDILLLMRQTGNVRALSTALGEHGHTCIAADSCGTMDEIFALNTVPDLALVDVAGFGEHVWSMCEKLQQADVPFVVLSAKQEMRLSSRTLRYGATSVLEKPVVKDALLHLIESITQAERKA